MKIGEITNGVEVKSKTDWTPRIVGSYLFDLSAEEKAVKATDHEQNVGKPSRKSQAPSAENIKIDFWLARNRSSMLSKSLGWSEPFLGPYRVGRRTMNKREETFHLSRKSQTGAALMRCRPTSITERSKNKAIRHFFFSINMLGDWLKTRVTFDANQRKKGKPVVTGSWVSLWRSAPVACDCFKLFSSQLMIKCKPGANISKAKTERNKTNLANKTKVKKLKQKQKTRQPF